MRDPVDVGTGEDAVGEAILRRILLARWAGPPPAGVAMVAVRRLGSSVRIAATN